ncbi:sensor histidine kinase [Gracilinema caldarium]|uniref:sensor histidine kinase n=1 Tax=Gracilinema caldarium TaxID=215591 RepID=UPI0026E9E1F6|nr:histidine kinase dimerization/phosphoacceptor domain -containing protein [Gracilinema caldarium]
MKGEITILFATAVRAEQEQFSEYIQLNKLSYKLLLPADLKEADTFLSNNKDIDIIVTDLHFASGAFADWLSLWPHPAIILAYYGEESKVLEIIHDESSSFLMRDAQYRHLGSLPAMIHKVLGVNESIKRQNAHLQLSEKRYMNLMNSLPDIVYTLDGDGRFVYVNEAISQLGFTPSELIGKHFSTILHQDDVPKVSRRFVLQELQGVRTGPEGAPRLFDERRTGNRMTKHLVVRLKPKSPSPYFETSAVVYAFGEVASVGVTMPEFDGGSIGTVGIIRDVSHHQNREEQLEKELSLKETLLKETYHRIKNNLQIVSSLLHLYLGDMNDPEAKAILYNVQNHIESISLVHEQLFSSEAFEKIETRSFIHSLVEQVLQTYEVDTTTVVVDIVCDSVLIGSQQAIPLSLVIVEVLAVSLNHLYNREKNAILVRFVKLDDQTVQLEVSDSSLLFANRHISEMGTTIIEALCQQLKGNYTWKRDGKSTFILSFPLFFDKPDKNSYA